MRGEAEELGSKSHEVIRNMRHRAGSSQPTMEMWLEATGGALR
jgi:hypothetical protein